MQHFHEESARLRLWKVKPKDIKEVNDWDLNSG